MSRADRVVRVEPLTPEGFAPFGDVVVAGRTGVRATPANQGTAQKFGWLSDVANLRPGRAKLNVAVFRCAPCLQWPFRVEVLERHASSTQVVVPMNADRYVVVVAPGNDDRPEPKALRAFIATSRQGVAYRPGTWHHPLLTLTHETDFTLFTWEAEDHGNCDLVTLSVRERSVIELA